jgi:hypothetical protein
MPSTQPRLAGTQSAPARRLYLADPDRPAEWPETLAAPDRPFVAFVAMDAGDVETDQLYAFAERLLDQGTSCVCAWGPDCERVHDLVDEAAVMRELDSEGVEPNHVMTTWHDNESLSEALDFALNLALPDEHLSPSRPDFLAVVVGQPDWARQVELILGAGSL